MSSIGERLKELRGHMSQEEFADLLDVHKNTLGNYERGQRTPDVDFLAVVARTLKVPTHWLVFGEGPKTIEEDSQSSPSATTGAPTILPTAYGAAAQQDFGLCLVKKVQARLCAGTGSLETSGDIKAYYAFREDWLLSKTRSAASLVLMDVYGDSMEPDIMDGDTVLVDESQRQVLAGRIYAVALDEEVVVKYLDKVPGKLLLRSRNERYSPIEVDLSKDIEEVRIVGRVLWWCREAS